MALFSASPRALQLAERREMVINAVQPWILGCGASAGGGTWSWLPQPVRDESRPAADAAAAGCELESASTAQSAPPGCGYPWGAFSS